MNLPDVAEGFQRAGITALIYDPRSIGLSGGMPRNDIDPVKQVEDYSDALTFLAGHPMVDPNRMAFWGISLSATVSLCAASFDKRAKLVIAVCPMTVIRYTPDMLPKVLAKCMKDRESQQKGNPPFYLPMLNERGENPAGFALGVDKEKYEQIVNAGKEIGPNHVNRTTIQSYHKMLLWQPFTLWKHLDPTPVMFLTPELDQLSPPALQRDYFEKLTGPKRYREAIGRGHVDVLAGEDFPALMKIQTEFFWDALEGRVNKE